MIRTLDDLIDRIAQDLVWRRRELTDMRALVQGSAQLRARVLVRSAIALLYAHWEGFVRTAATSYLEFVASLRIPYRRLAPNFVALSLRSKFNEVKAGDKLTNATALADFLCTSLDVQSRIPYKNVLETRSNVSSKVLVEIMEALGLRQDVFATRLHFIDANLVNPRNHIAHGEALSLTVDEYVELHDDVLALIEAFRTEVENSCVLKRYERQAQQP